MSEFEDRINSILSDPAQMEKIAGLAKSLMGNDGGAPASEGESGGLGDGLKGLLGEDAPDGELLKRIVRLMRSGSEKDNEKQALLEAMKPYLSEKRRAKMDRAMRLARLTRIARLAMGELGEGKDV